MRDIDSVCSKNPCEIETPKFGDRPPADRATCCSPGASGATCSDKNGLGRYPDPNPVTDEDCGEGFIADPTMAQR